MLTNRLSNEQSAGSDASGHWMTASGQAGTPKQLFNGI